MNVDSAHIYRYKDKSMSEMKMNESSFDLL